MSFFDFVNNNCSTNNENNYANAIANNPLCHFIPPHSSLLSFIRFFSVASGSFLFTAMPSILFPILAVSLLIPFSSCACDPENRENVCLVPSSCIVGNTLPKYQFVEFNSARDTIDNNYCTMIFMLKSKHKRQTMVVAVSVYNNKCGVSFHDCIKRASDPEFIEVNEVSCPKEVWAITYINQTVQKLGTEEFALKCVRNYCKFCGKISELTCDECTPIEYDDCQPQCKSQLWVRRNRIIKSNITCKPLDGNKEADSGLWYLVSNGVDTPFEEGSCYNGTYPLPAGVKAISDSSPSFSQQAILLVLLIAFI
ncbi:hypothetical protein PRIPAC_87720 [Pristionchus pacificus]|uniref:Uncharacterized protein n=1 Tax=Pristionchus pacificus TaxID=54126 RepID=A0A2A6CYI0_PRIPA|nr:hypothetical protein PRIPAC_87720 [Pristionchus pacificus]|eukprot:PDM83146.1 hypothetical protein PRIPAC_37539 [Pristionchus pacificus]